MTDIETNNNGNNSPDSQKGAKKWFKNLLSQYFVSVVLGVFIALVVWSFVARPFIVHGASMYPTFNSSPNLLLGGDYIIIDLLKYKFQEPKRGDIIVFDTKGINSDKINKKLIKRIVALPHETILFNESGISIKKASGEVFTLTENYLQSETSTSYKKEEIYLNKDEFFVLGDNRNNSYDSRYWGYLNKENIIGYVRLKLYPFKKAGLNPGKTEYEQ